jgi:hypothetical protein
MGLEGLQLKGMPTPQGNGPDQEWRCHSCKALLGKVGANPELPTFGFLRIKYKELYVQTRGGYVKITCYRCGAENETVDDDYLKVINEREKAAESQKQKEGGTQNLIVTE